MTEGSVYASTPFAGAELNSSSSIKINKIGVEEHVLDMTLDAVVFVGKYSHLVLIRRFDYLQERGGPCS